MESPQATIQSDDPLAAWSAEDKIWLEEHVPEGLRPVAVRHGRTLFQWVMMAGAANHALMILSNQTRGNQACRRACTMLENTMNSYLHSILEMGEKKLEHWAECKGDIERVAALQDTGKKQPGDRMSAGGIILDS